MHNAKKSLPINIDCLSFHKKRNTKNNVRTLGILILIIAICYVLPAESYIDSIIIGLLPIILFIALFTAFILFILTIMDYFTSIEDYNPDRLFWLSIDIQSYIIKATPKFISRLFLLPKNTNEYDNDKIIFSPPYWDNERIDPYEREILNKAVEHYQRTRKSQLRNATCTAEKALLENIIAKNWERIFLNLTIITPLKKFYHDKYKAHGKDISHNDLFITIPQHDFHVSTLLPNYSKSEIFITKEICYLFKLFYETYPELLRSRINVSPFATSISNTELEQIYEMVMVLVAKNKWAGKSLQIKHIRNNIEVGIFTCLPNNLFHNTLIEMFTVAINNPEFSSYLYAEGKELNKHPKNQNYHLLKKVFKEIIGEEIFNQIQEEFKYNEKNDINNPDFKPEDFIYMKNQLNPKDIPDWVYENFTNNNSYF